MEKRVRHVLGISGGKDSAALAIYLRDKYPSLDIEYYFCDTGKELDETYQLVENLEIYLGKKIQKLNAAQDSHEVPFDHFLKLYGGYLPSSTARWCTKKLKLEPFEDYVGDNLVVSYVGIRGDENREGYISKKDNIQSIFPFRKNIWSEDVINKLFKNENIGYIKELFLKHSNVSDRIIEIIDSPLSINNTKANKINTLLDLSISTFNKVVFDFLQTTNYPLANELDYPILENEDILIRDDIFRILRDSGVGVPRYYEKIEFEINGNKGEYARSRSGCFFCFYQQKIEWVWLFEQHPELFKKAMSYEKDGYTWMQNESLSDLIQPERIKQIKDDYTKKINSKTNNSPYLLDILDESEGEGCASCFI